MKLKRILAFVLILALVLSMPTFAFATEDRASDQIGRHNIKVASSSGQIIVTTMIFGMGLMNEIGCEKIYIYEKYGTGWLLVDWLVEGDDNTVTTNSAAHMASYFFDCRDGVEYRISVTLFAENDEGRDTVSQTLYVTGNSSNN